MTEQTTPRRMIKALLRGEPPPRPLLMPIIFSLGSRLESVPLHDFRANPTKIANALRQIRSVLKVDGLACYFDPFLEAEALGWKLNLQPDESTTLVGPHLSGVNDLRQKLRSPDGITTKGRIRIASEVLRRLKVMLKDEPALMIGVTGPLTLAEQLLGGPSACEESLPLDVVEFAAEVTAAVSRNFVEAGADVVFLVENYRTRISADAQESWCAMLDPIINVVRFYEALPVLLLNDCALANGVLSPILNRGWDCVLCPELAGAELGSCDVWQRREPGWGIAMPNTMFSREDGHLERSLLPVTEMIQTRKLVLLTSAGDIPAAADMKQVARVLDTLRSSFTQAA